jgi:hypothetical protein
MALRFDVGRLDRARRTGAGGVRVHGSLGRTGVQVYHDSTGREIREYRSPEEVFAPETLASLGGIPVTIGHPGAVSAANWRDVARGHVSDGPPGRRQDGQLEWLEGQVVISDAPTLARVDAGDLVELSLGYSADVLDQPGVAPNGERYDRVQKNIRFNHLALLQDGRARAGRGARLRLDSNGDEMAFRQDDGAPKRVKVDGIDCEVGSDTHVQMLERRADLASKRADEAEAKLTAANAEIGALKAKADAAPAPLDAAGVDRLVQDELAFRDSMRPLVGKDYSFSGKTREQVRLDAVGETVAAKAKALPDAQREGYLMAMLEQRAAAAERPTHQPAVVSTKADAEEPKRYDPFAIYHNAFKASQARADAQGKA